MNRSSYLIPVAILVAGLVIAVALYMVRIAENPLQLPEADVTAVRPVSPEDHIVGSPDAPVKIVLYSDIDCRYCKQFHYALRQIMADYGEAGKVAWVYRHFPVIEAHPNAAMHAKAAECVATLGGNTAFWSFIDEVHAAAPGDIEFNPDDYPDVVEGLGISSASFTSCMEQDAAEKRVAADYDNAIAIGAAGAPFSLILIEGSESISISGAVPYEGLKRVIDTALSRVK